MILPFRSLRDQKHSKLERMKGMCFIDTFKKQGVSSHLFHILLRRQMRLEQ